MHRAQLRLRILSSRCSSPILHPASAPGLPLRCKFFVIAAAKVGAEFRPRAHSIYQVWIRLRLGELNIYTDLLHRARNRLQIPNPAELRYPDRCDRGATRRFADCVLLRRPSSLLPTLLSCCNRSARRAPPYAQTRPEKRKNASTGLRMALQTLFVAMSVIFLAIIFSAAARLRRDFCQFC